jgi:hypothetical protein
MTVKKVFKSYIPSINYVTPSGRTCVFREGRYETNHPEEIATLSKEIKDGTIPQFYIDPEEREIDTSLQDAMRQAAQDAALKVLAEHNANKAGAKEEGKAAEGAQGNQQNAGQGASMSPAKLLNVANSASLKGLSAQSNQKS